MAAKIPTAGGTTVSFGNAPQASDDDFIIGASANVSGTLYFDVLADDGGGNAKTLYSIDDGTSAAISGLKTYAPSDLLTKDAVGAWQSVGTDGYDSQIAIAANGQVAFKMSAQLLQALNGTATGTYINVEFTYAIQLGNGTLSWATTTLSFEGRNHVPETSAASAYGNEDTPIAINLSGSDSDVGDSVAAFKITTAPAHGSLFLDAACTIAVNPNSIPATGNAATIYFKPDANWSGSTSFQYAAVDSHGFQDATPATALVKVTAVADAPILAVSPASGSEDTAIALSISSSLTDMDGSESLSITISGVPTGATLSAGINNLDGSWTLTPTQLAGLTITPPANSDGDFTLTVTAKSTEAGNGDTETASGTILVTINAVDDGDGTVTITGAAQEDSLLTANFGNDDPDGPATGVGYQWLRDGSDIVGATEHDLHAGRRRRGRDHQRQGDLYRWPRDAESVTSAATAAVANVNDAPVGAVTISGTATEDQVLTASNTLTDADGLGAITYQWLRDGSDIVGATSSTYTLGDADVGAAISVKATYTDGHGTLESVTSAATAAVANVNDAPVGAVTISGTATEDQVLTASNTLTDADGLGAITYQWLRDGSDIVGATSSTYTLGDADVGAAISVKATYTDGHGTPESVTSAATAAVANVNDAPSGRGDDQRDGDGGPGSDGVEHADGRRRSRGDHVSVAARRFGHRRRHRLDLHAGRRRRGCRDQREGDLYRRARRRLRA